MYVKSLTIQNYRNFGDPPFTIELRPFTLILGENNIGKTNLISALGLIFSQEITIARKRVLEIDDINYQAIQKFKKDVSNFALEPDQISLPVVRIDVFLTDLTEDQQSIVYQWSTNPTITEAQISYMFTPRNTFKKRMKDWVEKQREKIKNKNPDDMVKFVDFPIKEYHYAIFGGNVPAKTCEAYELQLLKMENLDALRDAQKELVASGDYRLLFRILNKRDETKYSKIKEILDTLQGEIDGNKNLAEIKTEVKNLLDKVSLRTNGVNNDINFTFSSLETNEVLKKLSMVYGSDPVNVSRNGLGRNNLLFITLVLSHLSSQDQHNEGEYHYRLISIEEPESHLHPHLQDHLADNIEAIRGQGVSDKQTQILLTSHSTHIAAKLNLQNTVAIYRDYKTGNLKSTYVLSNFDQNNDKQTINYLSKYLDATKSRIFFARKIILVEGISEQLLLPKLYQLYSSDKNGETLPGIGCDIVNVAGVAFRHFLKLINSGLYIKCLVLTDSDTGTKTEDRAENLKKEFNSTKFISIQTTKNSTFEKDLIEVNKSGSGKNILLRALKETRPKIGTEIENKYCDKDLDTEAVFCSIEQYKSEFAFNLLKILSENTSGFTTPDYIKNGFSFLSEE